jgi:putative ABC transport system permease protein
MSQAERVKVIYDHLNIILTTIVFLALTVLVVSALGMASATGINIMERTREIGVLRAIGATPEMIYKLFVAEGMITSVASVFLGLCSRGR